MNRAAALKAWATRRARAAQGAPAVALTIVAGKLADYVNAHDVALLALLRDEQLETERFTDQYHRGQWVRIQDNGEPVSGCSRAGGRGKRFASLAIARLHRIETELTRRGFSDEQISEHRFGDHETSVEREGIMLDDGDTTFDFARAG